MPEGDIVTFVMAPWTGLARTTNPTIKTRTVSTRFIIITSPKGLKKCLPVNERLNKYVFLQLLAIQILDHGPLQAVVDHK